MDHSERTHQEHLQRRLRSRGNGYAEFVLRGDQTIPQLFSERVARHPAKAAVATDSKCVTYEQLDRASQAIAGALRSEPGDERALVGLLFSEQSHFVAAALGTIRCGAAYVPLDPAFPVDRNARILNICAARLILTERTNEPLARSLASPQQRVLCVEDMIDTPCEFGDASHPHGLVHTIFTSGSTGKPKGVMQTSTTLLDVVRRYTNALFLGEHDHVSLLSSFSVAASSAPMFSALLNGATLYPFSVRTTNLSELADWIDAHRITLYHSVPSLFRSLLKSISTDRVFRSVQVVRTGGDSLYRNDWLLFKEHFPQETVLVNSYGCSEISSVARFYLDAQSDLTDEFVPVGRPANEDVQIGVIDEHGSATWLHECDDATETPIGEIVLKSAHVSPGYWDEAHPTLTAHSPAPDQKARRLYRTGDLGKVRGAQGLIHLGRGDSQVKLSGFRVELAEIEACLRGYAGVKEAAVVVLTQDNKRELLAVVEFEAPSPQSASLIRAHVASKLPAHMIPAQILTLRKLPCTPNGKIDRAALIELAKRQSQEKVRQAPNSPIEQALAEIWQQVLKVEQVGVDENFFELGCNSLQAMEVIAKIANRFQVTRLRVYTIFASPTIQQLAEVVQQGLLTQPDALVGSEYETGVL